MTDAAHARVDRNGLLIDASVPLLALNARAGGRIGATLAVPQLATVARIASTMHIPVSRQVIAADGDQNLELWVQATPCGEDVDLHVSGWAVRPPRASWLAAQPPTADNANASTPWRWRSDAALDLSDVTFASGDAGDLLPADLIGQPLTRLVRLIEDADGDLPILTALAESRAFAGQRAVRRDRPDVEIELGATPLHDAAGQFTGFDGTAGPVAVAPAIGAIDDAFDERLSRALRAPLDRIVARAETIGAQTDGPLRRDYAEYAGDIATAGRHLLALVDDLADLQAVERPGFAVEGETIDLADLARRAAGLLGVRAADRGVRIDRPDSDEGLNAHGDFRRTLQILVNLVGNAVRYSPDGGMVWLRTERDADTAVVVVADQGKGIAHEDQTRIFEKFERVDPGEPGGSGLGLYISRRLARAMGGDVTVDSAPGQGARFVLTLPASV